jgi:hypothetical protein
MRTNKPVEKLDPRLARGEIAGWSNGFLDFIAAMEGLNIPDVDETEVLNG